MLPISRASIIVLTLCTGLAAAPLAAAGARAPADSDPSAGDHDSTVRVSENGHMYYVDPVRPGTPLRSETRRPRARAALADTFDLHSLAGSRRTIFLDFDGTTVAGTQWNEDGLPDGFYEAWDPAEDGAGFSASERAMVQEIWEITAEDFAPFDVDVTTEDPGAAAIHRSGTGDQVYGTRVLLTDNEVAHQEFDQTFGVAFEGVFAEPNYHAFYQPAWVFPGPYSMKAVADTVSHEVGHTFGLAHDGKGGEEYYEGHGSWGPIMGSSDYRPIAQWSNGDYGGTNTENDIAVIAANGAPLRKDESAGEVSGAAAFPSGSAFISTGNDRDVFGLGTCEAGPVTLGAQPATTSPNLDIKLELLEADGRVLDDDNPLSEAVDQEEATGLDASIAGTLGTSRALYVRVDGVGRGSPATSYGEYGSVGAYTLDVTGCDLTFTPPPEVAAERPGRPTITKVKPGRPGGKKTAKVRWRPPSNAAAAEVEGYQLRAYKIRNRRVVRTYTSPIYRADARRAVWSKRARQRFKFAVRAVNEDGAGRWSKRSRTVRLR